MWLSNFRLVLPHSLVECGSLRIVDGVITDISVGCVPEAAIDGRGLTLIPGIVDLHGDMLEREIEPRPRAVMPIDLAIHELDKRLVASGITTAFAAVSFHAGAAAARSEGYARRIDEAVCALAPTLLTELRIHVRFDVTNPDAAPTLLSLMAQDDVHLISLTDHTPGQGQYRDIERFIGTMIEWRRQRSGVTHTEEDLRREVEQSMARPKAWEVVTEVAKVARQRGIPLASHDDDSDAKVAFMASLGAAISEFPVTVEAARAARAHGLSTVMGAPNALLGKSNTNNLSALDAVRAGLVDILAADYHPAALLQAAHGMAVSGLLSLPEAVALITRNPATALGLSDRGALVVGGRADLVAVDLRGEATDVRPRVRATFRGGRPVYWDGSIAGATTASGTSTSRF